MSKKIKFHMVQDGIYTLPLDAKAMYFRTSCNIPEDEEERNDPHNAKEIEKWEKEAIKAGFEGDVWYGSAYETNGTIFMSVEPKPYDKSFVFGTGFNYGSSNCIKVFEPCQILILAEND